MKKKLKDQKEKNKIDIAIALKANEAKQKKIMDQINMMKQKAAEEKKQKELQKFKYQSVVEATLKA